MSNCDVCIGGGYDGDSAEFFQSDMVKARKPHRCCECRQEIPKGAMYERSRGKWDGDFSSYKTCSLCVEIRSVFTCGESWLFQALWEDMREMAFPRLTTASECFTQLSAVAKQMVLDKWRQWKGLR
jgi:hypothetical protein